MLGLIRSSDREDRWIPWRMFAAHDPEMRAGLRPVTYYIAPSLTVKWRYVRVIPSDTWVLVVR
jgi:hypothetical protein